MCDFEETLYEDLVREICGDNWRTSSRSNCNAAWGVSIVKSVIDGVVPKIADLADHLGVDKKTIKEAFTLLSLNGVFLRGRLENDMENLKRNDKIAWGYYAGMASGATGPFLPKFDPSETQN